MLQVLCPLRFLFGISVLFLFLNEILPKGRIQRYPSNQSVCRMSQYASFITFYENRFQHFHHFLKCIPHFLIGLLVERQLTDGLSSWRTRAVIHQASRSSFKSFLQVKISGYIFLTVGITL